MVVLLLLSFSLGVYINFIPILWNVSPFQKDLFCLFSSLYSRFSPQLNVSTYSFISSLLYYNFFLHDCPKYISPGLDLSPYSPSLVNEFLSSFNVIGHLHTCIIPSTTTTTILDHYTSLLSISTIYKHILLEACSLVPTIADYNELITLAHLSIFVPLRPGELHIVINTGTSCSITSLHSAPTSLRLLLLLIYLHLAASPLHLRQSLVKVVLSGNNFMVNIVQLQQERTTYTLWHHPSVFSSSLCI